MGYNKVIYDGRVLIDLTGDNVTPDKLLVGATTHGPDGNPMTGECTFDVDSSDATATEAEVLSGKTFAKAGTMRTGSMKNNGAVKGYIETKDGKYTVPQGYHDGSGTVELDATEKSKLIPDNIRQGVTLFGVIGDMSGLEDAKPQAKTVTPKSTQQVVVPDAGYTGLSQVTVAAIPYEETDNAAGGKTVTVG